MLPLKAAKQPQVSPPPPLVSSQGTTVDCDGRLHTVDAGRCCDGKWALPNSTACTRLHVIARRVDCKTITAVQQRSTITSTTRANGKHVYDEYSAVSAKGTLMVTRYEHCRCWLRNQHKMPARLATLSNAREQLQRCTDRCKTVQHDQQRLLGYCQSWRKTERSENDR